MHQKQDEGGAKPNVVGAVSTVDLIDEESVKNKTTQYLAVLVLSGVICVFAFCVFVVNTVYPNHPQVNELFTEAATKNADGILKYAVRIEFCVGIAFGSSAINHLLAWFVEVHHDKRLQLLLGAYIGLVSCLTSAAYLLDYAPLFEDNRGNSVSVSPVRYLLWIFTTPVMVLMSQASSDNTWQQGAIYMVADVAIMVLGYLSEVVPNIILGWMLFLSAAACHCYVVYGIWRSFSSAMDGNLIRNRRYLNAARFSVIILWNGFPAMLLYKIFNPSVAPQMHELMMSMAHFFTKSIFTSLLVHVFCLSVSEKAKIAFAVRERKTQALVVKQLEELVKQKDTFLSATSHELRTPLHGIMGLTQGILAGSCGEINPNVDRILRTVEVSGGRLLGLINDILDSASMKVNNKLVVMKLKVSIKPLVQQAMQLISTLTKKDVSLHINIPEDLPDALGDEDRLLQVLNNLLGNAVKFTETGSITVSAEALGDGPEDMIQVSVADTGTGIPESAHQSIFQEFVQQDDVTTRQFGGTGLGLSLVKSLVEAHDGTVGVSSTVGKGSTFTFTLPKSPPDKKPGRMHRSSQASATRSADDERFDLRQPFIPAASEDGSALATRQSSFMLGSLLQVGQPARVPYWRDVHEQHMILSIDDDAVNHMVLEGFLKPRGFAMNIAMNGPEAISFLENAEALPDLILLDVMMPGMSGYEVNAKIKELFPTICIPVIMVSAKSTEADIVKGLESGSSDYIKKPFHQGELLARVQAQLQLKDARKREMESSMSVALLEQILPAPIINRLNAGAKCIADDHPETSILFSDIVGFTVLASSLTTMQVVLLLNNMFTAFDDMVDVHGVYKVETIGDAYMAASGHDGSSDHCERLFRMACSMIQCMERFQYDSKEVQVMKSKHLEIRVGLHTGPVYAGVVGRKCPRYCFFGDTVNTASRMESTGQAMCIQMSEPYFNRLDLGATSPSIACKFVKYEGSEIKGKGRMNTYVVSLDLTRDLPQQRPVREEAAKEVTRYRRKSSTEDETDHCLFRSIPEAIKYLTSAYSQEELTNMMMQMFPAFTPEQRASLLNHFGVDGTLRLEYNSEGSASPKERKCSTGNMQVEVVQHPLRPLQISRQDSGWEGPDGPYDSAGLSLEVAKTVEERVGGLLARQLADLQASLAAKLDSMQVALVPTVGSHGGAFAGELAASLQDHLASTQESVRGAQAAILAGVQSASEDTLHQLESLEELVAASEAARGEAHSELVAAQGSNHEDVRAAVANVLDHLQNGDGGSATGAARQSRAPTSRQVAPDRPRRSLYTPTSTPEAKGLVASERAERQRMLSLPPQLSKSHNPKSAAKEGAAAPQASLSARKEPGKNPSALARRTGDQAARFGSQTDSPKPPPSMYKSRRFPASPLGSRARRTQNRSETPSEDSEQEDEDEEVETRRGGATNGSARKGKHAALSGSHSRLRPSNGGRRKQEARDESEEEAHHDEDAEDAEEEEPAVVGKRRNGATNGSAGEGKRAALSGSHSRLRPTQGRGRKQEARDESDAEDDYEEEEAEEEERVQDEEEDELAQFLGELGLERYLQAMRDEDLDMSLLLLLSQEELKDIGVDSAGARRRIISAAKQMV